MKFIPPLPMLTLGAFLLALVHTCSSSDLNLATFCRTHQPPRPHDPTQSVLARGHTHPNSCSQVIYCKWTWPVKPDDDYEPDHKISRRSPYRNFHSPQPPKVKITVASCPTNLHFDPTTQSCRQPSLAECHLHHEQNETPHPTNSQTNEVSDPEDDTFHTQHAECASTYFFRRYATTTDGEGESIELTCPHELVWNSVTKTCSKCQHVTRNDGISLCCHNSDAHAVRDNH
ncbi:Peritrophin-1 [Folsomia candida]|uniref:Peritrophin-1 n=1 Tax=Folsomia candida TaxID=158441 RepID=A0A226D122_FOLCA|nr:Peritrophin-1 [Folsomia candida]